MNGPTCVQVSVWYNAQVQRTNRQTSCYFRQNIPMTILPTQPKHCPALITYWIIHWNSTIVRHFSGSTEQILPCWNFHANQTYVWVQYNVLYQSYIGLLYPETSMDKLVRGGKWGKRAWYESLTCTLGPTIMTQLPEGDWNSSTLL